MTDLGYLEPPGWRPQPPPPAAQPPPVWRPQPPPPATDHIPRCYISTDHTYQVTNMPPSKQLGRHPLGSLLTCVQGPSSFHYFYSLKRHFNYPKMYVLFKLKGFAVNMVELERTVFFHFRRKIHPPQRSSRGRRNI